MPYYPYRDRDSSGNWGSPDSDAALGILQEFLPQLCARYRETDAFYRSVSPSLVPGGDALRRAIVEAGCFPYPTDPPEIPVQPPQPIWDVGGFSYGSISTRWRDLVLDTVFNEDITWELPPNGNIGAPTSAPTLTTGVNDFLRVSVETLRPGNEAGTDLLSSQYDPIRYQFLGILSYSVQVSDGVDPDVPPSGVLPPGYAPPATNIPPVPIPRIPINIGIPQIPGFPDVNIPIEYSPELGLNGSVNIPLTFAPVANFGWEPTFAPRIELSLGGVSIFGGGYPEPVRDLEELVQESTDCDCPDPCPEPTDPVDYARVQTIVKNVVRTLNDLPGEVSPSSLGPSGDGAFVELTLPVGSIGVTFQIDLENYTGGASFGPTENTSVYYTGWYWWGRSGSSSSGERHFFTSSDGFIPAPRNSFRFTAVMRDGATISVQALTQPPIPDP